MNNNNIKYKERKNSVLSIPTLMVLELTPAPKWSSPGIIDKIFDKTIMASSRELALKKVQANTTKMIVQINPDKLYSADEFRIFLLSIFEWGSKK